MFLLGSMASHLTHVIHRVGGMPSEVLTQRKSSIEGGGMNSLEQEDFECISSCMRAGQRGAVWR